MSSLIVAIISVGITGIVAIASGVVYLKRQVIVNASKDVAQKKDIERLQESFKLFDAKQEAQNKDVQEALKQIIRFETIMLRFEKDIDETKKELKELNRTVIEINQKYMAN